MIRGGQSKRSYVDQAKNVEILTTISNTLVADYNDKLVLILKNYLTRETDQTTVLQNLKDLGAEVKSA